MNFTIECKCLLKPLQQVSRILRNRPTLPVLGNLLLQVTEGFLLLTSTDLEIEMIAKVVLNHSHEIGVITVPARKFYDICRALPGEAIIFVSMQNDRLSIFSGRSRYWLSTLPFSDFPNIDYWQKEIEFIITQSILKQLIESTQFSMACQDVRYCLNGIFFEINDKELRTVATDGHRLAICTLSINMNLPTYSIIIPRKSVIELMRMLDDSQNKIKICIGSNNICVHINNYIFTSKLINGCFPDYRRVLPQDNNKILKINRYLLQQAFIRVAIFANEKFRSARLYFSTNQLRITTNNQEQGEAEEILEAIYHNSELEIIFNIGYMLDILNNLKCDEVYLLVTNEFSSMQIENTNTKEVVYIVMPMRI